MIARAAALALAAALLPALACAEDPDRAENPPAVAPAAKPDPALNPLAALDKSALSGFRDTPLFTPSRRRPEPPPAPVAEAPAPPPPPAEEPPPEPPSIRLSGVVQGPGGAVAFVRHEADGRSEQLRLGDQIDGWLVTAIEADRLNLSLDQQEQAYRLFERRPAEPGSDEAGNEASSSGDDASDDQSGDSSAAAPDKDVDPPDAADDSDNADDARSSGAAAPDDEADEPEPPRRASRPRTQNERNRRPAGPEGSGQVDD